MGYFPEAEPGRVEYTFPSAVVTVIYAPAGQPSLIGFATTVTFSPGLKVFASIPARFSVEGPPASVAVAAPPGGVIVSHANI
jgi:hypothetical protein